MTIKLTMENRTKDMEEFASDYSLDGLSESEKDCFRAGWVRGHVRGFNTGKKYAETSEAEALRTPPTPEGGGVRARDIL